MHEQMYGSAERRQGGESVRACLPFPLLLLDMPKHRGKPAQPPFDFMLKNKAICLLFDFRKYSQNASKSTEATLKGIWPKLKRRKMGMQTFAMADANVCIRSCIYLHPGKQIFKGPKRGALQTTLSWLPRGKKPAEKPKNCTLVPFCAIFRNASQTIFCTKEMKCAWRFSILSKNAASFKLSFCKLPDCFP